VGILDDTLFLVTSDHGGHGVVHGTDEPEDMTIPWMLAGPGVRTGHTIEASVSIVDTAPTILHTMGIEAPESWMGQPILEVFED
jgi:arylsulfatase A-like enzyme